MDEVRRNNIVLDDKLLEKAKNAKSAEELLSLAKENDIELTDGEAKSYYAKLNAREGELADDDLDAVSGGGKCGTTYYKRRPVVSAFNSCDLFEEEGTRKRSGGYCKDCYFSKVDATSSVTVALICFNDERIDN